ncbi:hypothetical protein [Burkholderia sp. BCC1998]|uniref:hypothetical protein n=1 Tax=Burkholderia sp. BCC1998 TaxID=2817447 RepID=UPI002AB755B3|nr:hypothetical protein [Burkholderia sp. BCC1998]
MHFPYDAAPLLTQAGIDSLKANPAFSTPNGAKRLADGGVFFVKLLQRKVFSFPASGPSATFSSPRSAVACFRWIAKSAGPSKVAAVMRLRRFSGSRLQSKGPIEWPPGYSPGDQV